MQKMVLQGLKRVVVLILETEKHVLLQQNHAIWFFSERNYRIVIVFGALMGHVHLMTMSNANRRSLWKRRQKMAWSQKILSPFLKVILWLFNPLLNPSIQRRFNFLTEYKIFSMQTSLPVMVNRFQQKFHQITQTHSNFQ